MHIQVSCPINIALLKYWGKSDDLNVYPLTPSISLTLNQAQVGTITTVCISSNLKESHFRLDGEIKQFPSRLLDVLIVAQLRSRLAGKSIQSPFVCVDTENNFPTAAGLASSASGTAAFAFALGKLYSLDGDYTPFSRRGSGSSCRSLSGGFVYWSNNPDDYTHRSSIHQLFPASHWPELKLLICVTSEKTKPVGSTVAMRNCVQTSDLFRSARLPSSKQHEITLIAALKNRDFSTLAEVTMRESNQLHALCLDTWPPCTYLSHTSHCIMTFVHQINKHFKRNFVAYTFDAGANAFLLVELKNIPIILRYLTECFGCPLEVCDSAVDPESSAIHSSNNSTKHLKITGIPYTLSSDPVDQSLLEKLPCNHGGILYVISTEVGDGPQLISFVEDD